MFFKRKLVILILSVIFSFNIFAQSFQKQDENIEYAKFVTNFSYYGFPMTFLAGYNYRNNNFNMILPYAGISMDIAPDFQIDSLSGVQFNLNKFYFTSDFNYELYAAGINSFSDKSQYFGRFNAGYNLSNGRINLESKIGKLRWYDNDGSIFCLPSLIEKLSYSILLYDNLIFKSTGNICLTMDFIPEENFSAYSVQGNFPFQFNWYYGESTFLISSYYADYLKINDILNTNYRISKSYSAITERFSFSNKTLKYYNFIVNFETEQRFYISRYFNKSDNFFISLFGNVAAALDSGNEFSFLYQYGLGAGYNLYGCVPFTIQAGFDNENNFIVYLGVVSRVAHSF